ncbi:MAG: CoA-transferase [Candidatus Alcyoniella australis]|nr:CoA-transferase [Candidatus Alcyoniella australis]
MKELFEGQGPLFTDPDPDHAREHFRKKERGLVNKLMPVKQAVEQLIHDGDYLAVGGFGGVRIPTSVLHEIVRQGRKNLGFSGHTSTHDCQILAAGECFDRCDIAYIIGLEARGLSPNSRRYFESGKVKVCEWTNAGMYWRYQAAALGVPFIPGRSMLGTDTNAHSGAKTVECPYTGKPIVLFPALYPDVAVIHVHEADIYGNARIRGNIIADHTLARASKHVILTTERLISSDEIRREPASNCIPYFCVDAVCVVPYGAFPSNMPYLYFSDEDHLRLWLDTERDVQQLDEFVKKYIYGTNDFEEYLRLCGGLERMAQLERQELLIPEPGQAAEEAL